MSSCTCYVNCPGYPINNLTPYLEELKKINYKHKKLNLKINFKSKKEEKCADATNQDK